MNSNPSESDDLEIICLDSSQESSSSIIINNNNNNNNHNDEQAMIITEENDEKVTVCEKSINFDKTLPPGAAPDGFILLDESVEEIIDNPSNNDPEEKHKKHPDKDTPLFKVVFRDKSTIRRYKEDIRNFLTKLVSGRADDEDDENDDDNDLVLNIYSCKNHQNKRKSPPLFNENGIDKVRNNTLFIIDTEPGLQDELNIPAYGKKYETVLKEPTSRVPEGTVQNTAAAAPKLNCFNCLGNHNLRDCTEPRNPMEINKNRKEFSSRSGPKNVRYHVDDDTKYDSFKPGLLSQELRKALGLADNQLPRHIYKMRILGYPPGWLEEARLQHSGLNLYNSEGLRETVADEEPGEIFSPESRDQYDIKKIYDFPGYNVPALPGTVNAQMWNAEEQEIHSKEAMLAMMDGKKVEEGYKRKKLKRNTIADDSDSICLIPAEMEVEQLGENAIETVEVNGHFIPPVPDSSKQPSPPPPPPPAPQDSDSQTSLDDSSSRVNSPSLIELEDRKKRLLEALDDSTQSNPATPSRLSSSLAAIPETPPTLDNSSSRIGRVTSIELGTPLIQSTSPFTKLPSSENFSKDICDVINFENLPNSTGKYEKMSGILQKARDTLSNSFVVDE